MMRMMGMVLLAAAVSAGCASMSRDTTEPPVELQAVNATLPVQQAWRISLGDSGERTALAPVIAGDQVYAASADGRVMQVELETGRIIWERQLDMRLTAGPGVGDGTVVVGARNGRVIALDGSDGSVQWQATVSSDVLGTPGVTRSIIGVLTGDQVLVGLAASSGEEMWRVEQTVPALTMRGTAGVTPVGEVLVTGFANGRVLAAQVRDGNVIWELPFAVGTGRTEIERMVDVTATPRALGRDVYAVSYQGRLAALSSDSGRVLWSRDFSSTAGLAVDADGVWVTDADSEIWAFDRVTGSERWRQAGLRARSVTAPAAGAGWVALGDFEGWLHLLDASTGEFVNRVRVDREPMVGAPVASGRILVVQGGGGSLTAYRVGD
jgi:outer membrane protein assembly factor BamB